MSTRLILDFPSELDAIKFVLELRDAQTNQIQVSTPSLGLPPGLYEVKVIA